MALMRPLPISGFAVWDEIRTDNPENAILPAIKTAMSAVRDGGTILIFGSKPNNEIIVDWWDIWRREINLITSYSATSDLMPRAMALLAGENYSLESLVSHEFSLAEAQQGFELAHQGRVGKVVVTDRKKAKSAL